MLKYPLAYVSDNALINSRQMVLLINFLLFFGFFGAAAAGIVPDNRNIKVFVDEEKLPIFPSDSILDTGVMSKDKDLPSPLLSYALEKATSKQLRTKLKQDLGLEKITMDGVKTSFTDHLVNRIIPHWYGTKWSFGGHTSIPKTGEIACGYFVSTTLRDMGINVNRYRLAQKSPIDEARMISCGSEITTINAADTASAIQQLDQHTREGLYFIGFDEGHVGFLLKKEGELFLVHSNYLAPVAVCMQPIETSNVFKKFSVFHVVDISHNDLLIQKWLDGSAVL